MPGLDSGLPFGAVSSTNLTHDIPTTCKSAFIGGKDISALAWRHTASINWLPSNRASRFWAFQGLEASIFVVLAVALIAFAYWRVLTRDD